MNKKYWLKIRNVKFNNPILTASGTCGYGEELKKFYNINRLGGLVTKGITLEPREGNRGERLYETGSGLMNSIGLENPGMEEFIDEIVPELEKINTNVIVNISGFFEKDFVVMVKKLDRHKIAGFEVNVSCPNLKKKGEIFGKKTAVVKKLGNKLRGLTKKLLIFKLSPDADDIVRQALALEQERVDAVTVANTYPGLALNKNLKPVFNNTFAGVSGPAIKPLTLRLVWRVSDKVSIPVIASGGIIDFQDGLEYMAAGASLIQLGTINLIDPRAAYQMVKQFEKMKRENPKKLKGIIGSAKIKE